MWKKWSPIFYIWYRGRGLTGLWDNNGWDGAAQPNNTVGETPTGDSSTVSLVQSWEILWSTFKKIS